MKILTFLYLVTGYKKFFDQREIKKMSLSVHRSVVEQFSFNRKRVQSVHVKGEECLVSRDVYKAIGYEGEYGKKAIQYLVPSKFMLRHYLRLRSFVAFITGHKIS